MLGHYLTFDQPYIYINESKCCNSKRNESISVRAESSLVLHFSCYSFPLFSPDCYCLDADSCNRSSINKQWQNPTVQAGMTFDMVRHLDTCSFFFFLAFTVFSVIFFRFSAFVFVFVFSVGCSSCSVSSSCSASEATGGEKRWGGNVLYVSGFDGDNFQLASQVRLVILSRWGNSEQRTWFRRAEIRICLLTAMPNHHAIWETDKPPRLLQAHRVRLGFHSLVRSGICTRCLRLFH